MSTFNIKEIIDRLELGQLGGAEIADYRNYCAAWLARFNREYGELVATGAGWITANRDNYKSHAECERAWQATPQGAREIELKYQIRALEHVSDALLTNHMLLQREYKDS